MSKCKDCAVGLLGVCNVDFCRAEREVLVEEVRRFAERHGHTLTEFIKVEGYPIWQARCVRCGLSAAINLDPLPNEAIIYGEALTADCPEIDVDSYHRDQQEEIEHELAGGYEELWIERLQIIITRDEAD
jgi:hypothetical protein